MHLRDGCLIWLVQSTSACRNIAMQLITESIATANLSEPPPSRLTDRCRHWRELLTTMFLAVGQARCSIMLVVTSEFADLKLTY